jgi:hypothetical protein
MGKYTLFQIQPGGFGTTVHYILMYNEDNTIEIQQGEPLELPDFMKLLKYAHAYIQENIYDMLVEHERQKPLQSIDNNME